METNGTKTKAMIMHLSTLTQYFFPLGNFIFPVIIWSSVKKDSTFLDSNGKQAINFQLSIFVYSMILFMIAVPILLFTIFRHIPISEIVPLNGVAYHGFTMQNITGIVILGIVAFILCLFLKIAEFFLVIYASTQAAEGITYKYPLSIPFFK
jgi:uncharacterized Tic20 family protein